MADNTDNSDKINKDADIPIPTALPSSAGTESSTSANGSWTIPYGMEDHIESGFMKAAAGVAIGSLVGLAMFRSGKGYRSATAAAGLGVALGSTFERARGNASSA